MKMNNKAKRKKDNNMNDFSIPEDAIWFFCIFTKTRLGFFFELYNFIKRINEYNEHIYTKKSFIIKHKKTQCRWFIFRYNEYRICNLDKNCRMFNQPIDYYCD